MKKPIFFIIDHALGIPVYIMAYIGISAYLLGKKLFGKREVKLDITENFYH